MEDVVIDIKGLKKKYKLGTIGGGTLRGEIQSKIAMKRGKEDPNAIIGSKSNYNKEFWALKGVDLQVHRGERLGIIGCNGAGKSTLLKIISRITAPTEGEITYEGRIASMLEVGTGFHGELTGRENIYMNAAILGMSKNEVDEKMDNIIDFSECGEFIDTPVKRYSSGMYVKLAFSVAAHLNSEIMIMDEVLAVGDVNFQNKCIGKMLDIAQKENRTILYVSHNMSTIKKLCDRCIVLSKGEKIFDGDTATAMEIYNSSANRGEEEIIQSDEPRRFGEKARFTKFELDNKQDLYECSEFLETCTEIKSFEDLVDVHVRFLFKYPDSSIAGTFFSNEFDILKKQIKRVKAKIPLSVLPEGDFYLRLVLSKRDEYGAWEDFSEIEHAMTFSVRKSLTNYNGMNWTEGWRVNLGSIQLEEEK